MAVFSVIAAVIALFVLTVGRRNLREVLPYREVAEVEHPG